MSELINNRQEKLKLIIKQIHDGLPLEEAKARFKKQFGSVTTKEITAMEQQLIEEGMDIAEVQRLCDVHAAVFDGSISDIHRAKDVTEVPGHPAYVLKNENERIQQVIDQEIKPYINQHDKTSRLMLTIGFERLSDIKHHYARKENLIFPRLEKRGVTSVSKVMWGVDTEIKQALNQIIQQLRLTDQDIQSLMEHIQQTVVRIEDMITKENHILLPMLVDKLSLYDWILIDEGSPEIGYFLEAPTVSWKKGPQTDEIDQNTQQTNDVSFDAGSLSSVELNAILNTVPFDMTFIDKDGYVKYFTQGKERIFERPKTIIGRHVNLCHPPQSVHIVEEIVNRFKDGTKDHEDFWINMHHMFVHIRYYAIRDAQGNYLGTLEVTQDIKPLRELKGEKRLMEK